MNPKIKFAIHPTSSSAIESSSSASLPSDNRYDFRQQKPANDPFDHSIDSLLDMLNSPERKNNSSSGSGSGFGSGSGSANQTSNYSTPKATTTSQYSSYSSSTTPVVTPSHLKASPSYTTPSYKSSSYGNDTSFDDILSGLESPIQSSKTYTSTSTANSSLSRPNSISNLNTKSTNVTVISSSTPSDGGKTRFVNDSFSLILMFDSDALELFWLDHQCQGELKLQPFPNGICKLIF